MGEEGTRSDGLVIRHEQSETDSPLNVYAEERGVIAVQPSNGPTDRNGPPWRDEPRWRRPQRTVATVAIRSRTIVSGDRRAGMDLTRFRRIGYGAMVVQGALAAVAPRLSVKLNAQLWRCAFENVGELEPKPWYRRLTRALGGGLVVAGLLGLLQEPVTPRSTERDDDGADDDGDGAAEIEIAS